MQIDCHERGKGKCRRIQGGRGGEAEAEEWAEKGKRGGKAGGWRRQRLEVEGPVQTNEEKG